MTTISTRTTLSDPLARTKGVCATETSNSHHHQHRSATIRTRSGSRGHRHDEDDGSKDDGFMHLGMSTDEVDEEIASVEADGTAVHPDDVEMHGTAQHADGGGRGKQEDKSPVDNLLLTAALVGSIVEASSSAVSAAEPSADGRDDCDGIDVTRRSNRKRRKRDNGDASQSEDDADAEYVDPVEFNSNAINDEKFALKVDLSLKQTVEDALRSTHNASSSDCVAHVTPPTSESSSFSSVEDHESTTPSSPAIKNMPQLNTSATSSQNKAQAPPTHHVRQPSLTPSQSQASSGKSRTIYPRASKIAAGEKVAAALANPFSSSPGSSPESSPRSKKRTLNLGVAPPLYASAAGGKGPVSFARNASGMFIPRSALPSIGVKNPLQKPGTAAVLSHHHQQMPPPPPHAAKCGRGVMGIPAGSTYGGGLKISNPPPVPNPLAGLDSPRKGTPQAGAQTVVPPPAKAPPSKCNAAPKSTKKTTSSGMSSKTNTLMSAAPQVALPSFKAPSISATAENVAQADTLISSTSEVPPQARGRIFSIDLDRELSVA